jgi:hypothetical protein
MIEEHKVKCNQSTNLDTIEVSLDKCRKCSYYKAEIAGRISCSYPYKVILSTSRFYTIKRRPRIQSRLICEICGHKFGSYYTKEKIARHEQNCRKSTEEKHSYEKKQKQRDYDLNLLVTESIPSYRKYLAIYRLYAYHNMTTKQIAYHLSYSEARVRDIIGLVFSELCRRDKKCVFRKLFVK